MTSARIILPFVLLFCSVPLQARMYQWTNPDTGTTQLSGTPPSWYRGTEHGSRVYVFERGQLVDDTAQAVSEVQRLGLRRQAFMAADRDKLTRAEAKRTARLRAAVERLLGKKASDEELEAILQGPPETMPPTGSELPSDEPADTATANTRAAEASEPTEEQLKALVESWERTRTEKARRLLQKDTPLSDYPASASTAARGQGAAPPPAP